MKASDLITRAMRRIGVLAAGAVPTADEMTDGFSILNEMIDSWTLERLMLYAEVRALFPLTNAVNTYTIGVGGVFNAARPLAISKAGLVRASPPAVEVPLHIFTDTQYERIPVRSITGEPQGVYLIRTWPLATVFLLPIPDSTGLQLALSGPTAIAQFADISSTDYTFAPGYARAIRYNLAVELAPEYGVTADPVVMAIAAESKGKIKAANIQLDDLGFDPALLGVGARYDIYTDSVRQ